MSNVSKSSVLTVVLLALMLAPINASAREISGVWGDPNQSGSAITLLQEGGVVLGGWFFYGEGGIDTWFAFVGPLVNDTMSTNLLRFTGPPLGSTYDPSLVQSSAVGTVTLNVRSRGVIDFNYSITRESDGPAIGTLRLVPFSLTVSDTERLAELAGFYTGTFKEGLFNIGIFAVRLDNFGTITGVSMFTFPFSGTSCSDSGTFTANGEFTVTALCPAPLIGAVGSGTVSPSGVISGTWESDTGLQSGTLSGLRQD